MPRKQTEPIPAAEGAIPAGDPFVQTVKAALVAMDVPASDQDVQAAASDEAVKAACAKVQELDLRLAKAEKDFAAKDARLQELNERIAGYDAGLKQLDRLIANGKKFKKEREARIKQFREAQNKLLKSRKKVSFQ